MPSAGALGHWIAAARACERDVLQKYLIRLRRTGVQKFQTALSVRRRAPWKHSATTRELRTRSSISRMGNDFILCVRAPQSGGLIGHGCPTLIESYGLGVQAVCRQAQERERGCAEGTKTRIPRNRTKREVLRACVRKRVLWGVRK